MGGANSTLTINKGGFVNNFANSGNNPTSALDIQTLLPVQVVANNVFFSGNRVTGNYGQCVKNTSDGATLILNNATFSDNGLAIDNSAQIVLTNTLFWNSSTSGVDTSGNGNSVVTTDPFVNSAQPFGPDGIPRTADDGLRIAAGASDVINQGVTGANVPATDILGNARVGNPEPGAYEYLP